MKGDPKVLELLNEALKNELTAPINIGCITGSSTIGAWTSSRSSSAANQSTR